MLIGRIRSVGGKNPADFHHVFVSGKLAQKMTSPFDFQEDHVDNPVKPKPKPTLNQTYRKFKPTLNRS